MNGVWMAAACASHSWALTSIPSRAGGTPGCRGRRGVRALTQVPQRSVDGPSTQSLPVARARRNSALASSYSVPAAE